MSRRPASLESARAFGPLFFFCVGALAARFATGLLPPFFSSTFEVAVYAGIAISVAIAYRRFVRGALEDRRRVRAQQQRVITRPPVDEDGDR